MIQRRALSENMVTNTCIQSRLGTTNLKVTVKEKKAAKRKEKSRVAAQIRRNKESQTLILLQNALPLALPSPSQMLEKSIVIRIAGQALFLMNTLDQVLGMDGWLTIPLISNNFLTFFMDSIGQIVYASPNIQLLLEQHHWSNLIGMSITEVVDFKSRWPTVGESVRLKLSSNHIINNDSVSFESAITNSQQSSSRTAIASRLSLRKNSQAWNCSSSTCSLYNVWCYTNINHTNSKLKLLILQAVQIKSSILNNAPAQHEAHKHVVIATNVPLTLERSISWPSISSSVNREQLDPINLVYNNPDDAEPTQKKSTCIYQKMITSAHDRFYRFKSASTEFCQLTGESPKSIINFNFLDIIHLEDVIKVKSFLDLVVENNDSHIWTPIYRIMCKNGRYCVLRTLAKQYCTVSSHTLILNHLVIKTSQVSEDFFTQNMYKENKVCNSQESLISMKSVKNEVKITPTDELYIIHPNLKSKIIIKRKSLDKKRVITSDKYPRMIDRTMSGPSMNTDMNDDFGRSPNSSVLHTKFPAMLCNEMLSNDPFVPMDLEKGSTFDKKPRKDAQTSVSGSRSKLMGQPLKSPLRLHTKFDSHSNRSPSYSLESYVLTSPGSESNDLPLDDQFVWDVNSSFQDITQLNSWLDEHYQNDLELILPI